MQSSLGCCRIIIVNFGVWTSRMVKHHIWDSVTHIVQIHVIFEEIRAFLVETDIFGPKTLGRCTSYISEALGAWYSWRKRRFVHQNTSKITVPAGLARHAWCKKCKSLFRIRCIDLRFQQITQNQSTDFEQQNTWNVLFGIPWHILKKIMSFVKNSWQISDQNH